MEKRLDGRGTSWVLGDFLLLMLLLEAHPIWAQSAEQGMSGEGLMRGLGIGTALIALIWLLCTEFLFRHRLQRGTYHWMLLLGLLVFPFMTLISTTSTLFEETKTVRSCAACHAMDPFVSDLRNPDSTTLAARHYRNKWIPAHQCYTCHTTYGMHGALQAKLGGVRHWWRYVTGTWQEPIRHRGPYPNSNCLFCHAGTPKFAGQAMHTAMATDLTTNKVGCVTCHGPPHPPPSERPLTKRPEGDREGSS